MAKNNTTPVEETNTPVTVPEEETSSVEGAAPEEETTSAAGETTDEEKTAGEEATTLVEATPNKIAFTKDGLGWSLPIMGKGMLGIFIVTTIIVTVTVVLNKVTAPRKKNKEKKDK